VTAPETTRLVGALEAASVTKPALFSVPPTVKVPPLASEIVPALAPDPVPVIAVKAPVMSRAAVAAVWSSGLWGCGPPSSGVR